MSIPYLIDYLDVLDSLPSELSRQVSLLKEVDSISQSSKSLVKQLTLDFLENINSKDQDKTQILQRISLELKKIKGIGYQQLQISTSTCQMVNEHLSRLESDLLRFEEDQLFGIKESPKKKIFDSPRVSKEISILKSIDALDKVDIIDKNTTMDKNNMNASAIRRTRATRATRSNTITESPQEDKIETEIQSPVLHSEPTYCICSQVSFGEMIACDNEDCIIEWFHYKKLDLSSVKTPIDTLEEKLDVANDFAEWSRIALELDMLRGYEYWKFVPHSHIYDYKQIKKRTIELLSLLKTKDFSVITYALRSGLLRNFCGVADTRLFSKYYLGTKLLIEDYNMAYSELLKYISLTEFTNATIKEKYDMLNDCKQSYGCTALVFQGGSTFGLIHLGVAKSLFDQRLLPRIICGSSVGALIAALVCTHTEAELPDLLNGRNINLEAFSKKSVRGTLSRKLTRFLTKGYFLDVKVIEDVVRQNLGEATFDEAYQKTKRVLNIIVSTSREAEVPRVLNYLTAPNVLIWSAAVASCSSMGLYESVSLLAKDEKGDIVHWSPSEVKWDVKFVDEMELPESRLAELFNVNHFIVSQATPYIAPFLSSSLQDKKQGNSAPGLLGKMVTFLSLEFRHRIYQLAQLRLIPSRLLTLVDQRAQGNITISPVLDSSDFYTLFASPTASSMNYWLRKGEKAAWPFLSLIRSRTSVEFALEKESAYIKSQREKSMRRATMTNISRRKFETRKRRTLS